MQVLKLRNDEHDFQLFSYTGAQFFNVHRIKPLLLTGDSKVHVDNVFVLRSVIGKALVSGVIIGYKSGNTYGLALDSILGYKHIAGGIVYHEMVKYMVAGYDELRLEYS